MMTSTTDDALAHVVGEVCRVVGATPGDPTALVRAEVRRLAPLASHDEQIALATRAVARLTGLGELDAFLHDPGIDEVLVNGAREIWIDRAGVLAHVGTLEADRVDHLIERVLAPLGRRVDRSSPIVDARLPDGARICAVLPPVAVDGAALSIRRFQRRGLPIEAFTDRPGRQMLLDIVAARCNVLVCGATSSGKTSLVAALLASCAPSERLLIVEDTTELPIAHRHAVRLEARPASVDGPAPIDLAQLVRTALRLRPDRIVVGEVRGDEVLALVQAMNTGHDGSMSTCHANGPLDALLRLESLVLQAAPTWPLAAIRHQLARSIDVVVHVDRQAGAAVRRVTSITEVALPVAATDGSSTPPGLIPLAQRTGDGTTAIVGTLTRGRR